jgi:hypothetical protein
VGAFNGSAFQVPPGQLPIVLSLAAARIQNDYADYPRTSTS